MGVIPMRTSECSVKKELPFTVNIIHKEERENLNRIGNEIAAKEGLQYEGYTVFTAEPYSIEKAKPTLFFN
jgi:hypothetical protein